MWSEGRRWVAGAGLGLVLLGSSPPAAAQVYRSAEERFFRIEWHVERAGGRDAAIVGVLDNPYLFRDTLMVLLHGDALPYKALISREAIEREPVSRGNSN